ALILLVIPESRSDIRDPAPLHFGALRESHWVPACAGMTSNRVIRGSITARRGNRWPLPIRRTASVAPRRKFLVVIPGLAPAPPAREPEIHLVQGEKAEFGSNPPEGPNFLPGPPPDLP